MLVLWCAVLCLCCAVIAVLAAFLSLLFFFALLPLPHEWPTIACAIPPFVLQSLAFCVLRFLSSLLFLLSFVSFPPSSLLRANSFLCQTAIPESKICVWLAADVVWRQFSVSSDYLHVFSKLFFLPSYGQTLFVACDIFSCIVFLLSVV